MNLCHRQRLPHRNEQSYHQNNQHQLDYSRVTIQNNRLFEKKITFTNGMERISHKPKYLRLCLSWPNDIMQSSDNHHHHHFIVPVCRKIKSTHIKKSFNRFNTSLSFPYSCSCSCMMWCTGSSYEYEFSEYTTSDRKNMNRLVESLTFKSIGNGSIVPPHHTFVQHTYPMRFSFFFTLWFLMPFRAISVHVPVGAATP